MIQVAEDIMLEITNSRGGVVRETITPGKWEKKKTVNNLKCLIVNYFCSGQPSISGGPGSGYSNYYGSL